MFLEQFLAEYGHRGAELPEIAGRYAGKSLVVCGDAAGVWFDLERFGCAAHAIRGRVEKPGWHFMTINKLIEVFPGNVEHAYSNEPSLLQKFIAARRSEYAREFDGPRHTHSCNQGAKWKWPWGGFGTSALGAAIVGVGLGYDQIVLCGIPLDDGPHNGEPPWRRCAFTNEAANSGKSEINAYWKRARDLAFHGRVKSMSGRTKDWLGCP